MVLEKGPESDQRQLQKNIGSKSTYSKKGDPRGELNSKKSILAENKFKKKIQNGGILPENSTFCSPGVVWEVATEGPASPHLASPTTGHSHGSAKPLETF